MSTGMVASRVATLVIVVLACGTSVGAGQPVAVVTELLAGTGDIRARRAGEGEWLTTQPLLALRAGDQLRATGDARAVIVFSGGEVQTVTAANSPFTVHAPAGRSGAQGLQALMSDVVRFLAGHRRGVAYEGLSVRGGPVGPPRIVSPRQTRLLPGPLAFEWTGSPALRYRVRLTAADGTAWEMASIAGRRADYPASAPTLRPGGQYSWSLEAPGQPAQRTEFDVVSTEDARRIQAALADLRPPALPAYPATTVTVMRVALLLQERLYADARQELLSAIEAHPDAPSLRELLGHVYEQTGLADLAAREFGEATSLARPGS